MKIVKLQFKATQHLQQYTDHTGYVWLDGVIKEVEGYRPMNQLKYKDGKMLSSDYLLEFYPNNFIKVKE